MDYELGIMTNDGWVISLVADKPITLGDAIVKSVIVQPREDYARRLVGNRDTPRCLYRLNAEGVVVYEHGQDCRCLEPQTFPHK